MPCGKQFPETFSATYDSIVGQGISLGRIAVKRIVRYFLLAATPAFFVSVHEASARQSAPQNSAGSVQTQAPNQASSHDRPHRRYKSGKRHLHHHKPSAQHGFKNIPGETETGSPTAPPSLFYHAAPAPPYTPTLF